MTDTGEQRGADKEWKLEYGESLCVDFCFRARGRIYREPRHREGEMKRQSIVVDRLYLGLRDSWLSVYME